MPETKASEDLDNLRAILVGPFEEHLRLRDEKILDVITQMQSAVFDRVSRLEEIVASLSESLDQDRNRTVTEIGDAMAQLGQQLRTFGIVPGENSNPIDKPVEQPEMPIDEPAAQATG
jgi:hypothetical protein